MESSLFFWKSRSRPSLNGRNNIAEVLLKVALNTINTYFHYMISSNCMYSQFSNLYLLPSQTKIVFCLDDNWEKVDWMMFNANLSIFQLYCCVSFIGGRKRENHPPVVSHWLRIIYYLFGNKHRLENWEKNKIIRYYKKMYI